jgi:hypothetical protein
MKTIEPVVFPLNLGTAIILNANCISDNLSTSATFYYALLSDTMTQLSQGNLTMTGQDYADWQTNQYAYDWIATQIDVTIIGDYVPPVPEPIVPETNEPLNSILADLRQDAHIDEIVTE